MAGKCVLTSILNELPGGRFMSGRVQCCRCVRAHIESERVDERVILKCGFGFGSL